MGIPGALRPALLNNTSRRPNSSLILSNSAPTDDGSLTSVGTTSVREPLAWAISAVSSRGSFRRPTSAVAYPASHSEIAACLPIPVPAPVTRATFSNEAKGILLISGSTAFNPHEQQ